MSLGLPEGAVGCFGVLRGRTGPDGAGRPDEHYALKTNGRADGQTGRQTRTGMNERRSGEKGVPVPAARA